MDKKKNTAVLIARGVCTLGRVTTDKDGNVISRTPAKFVMDEEGSCFAVCPVEVNEVNDDIDSVTQTGDASIAAIFDTDMLLTYVMEKLGIRQRNTPDLAKLRKKLFEEKHIDLCDYCHMGDELRCECCPLNGFGPDEDAACDEFFAE